MFAEKGGGKYGLRFCFMSTEEGVSIPRGEVDGLGAWGPGHTADACLWGDVPTALVAGRGLKALGDNMSTKLKASQLSGGGNATDADFALTNGIALKISKHRN